MVNREVTESMNEFFLKQLHVNLAAYSSRIAFRIEERNYTYAQLGRRIVAIQQEVLNNADQQYFGVVTHNSIETYAAIFAIWLSGKTLVPIGLNNPHERNQFIIEQVGIKTLFDVGGSVSFANATTIDIENLLPANTPPVLVEVPNTTDLYVLFTSGSTGFPKGVRITQANFDAYLKAFFSCGYQFSPSDRCLQVYELTFDASVQCYTFPLLVGASVFTLPQGNIKFLSIMKVMTQHQITFAKMPPSVIYYLKAYFDKINLPHLRYCLFGAEAFPVELVELWEKCIPNAEIQNVYGPTEATINCTWYAWNRLGLNKSRNGVASIGREYANMKAIICDENLQEVQNGIAGELCMSGPQITPGYWKSPENDQKAFFLIKINGRSMRFYRTGDLAIKDEDGDILFIGRADSQVQIDGHRIELGEMEYHASVFSKAKCIAQATKSDELNHSIVLFIEMENIDKEALVGYLGQHLPLYMIPEKIVPVAEIPLLSSGKTDRKSLMKMI